MTVEKLKNIIGSGSMLKMIIAPIKYNILVDPSFGWCDEIDCDFRKRKFFTDSGMEYVRQHLQDIAVYQWGSGAFLNNTDLYISGVTPVLGGIANPSFSSELFYSSPEFGIFLDD